MNVTHTENDEGKAAGLAATRSRFLLARQQVSQCSAEPYRAVRKLRDRPAADRRSRRGRRA